ncbi:MAG: GHKL domain-containing protein, partial [Pyrinomonadaceae bacterium]|nr:GHKL domain-containing protein [Pyrinomonadaceae bacterium]
INRAAIGMLRLEDADFTGVHLKEVVSEENARILERLISRARRIGQASEQTTLARERENQDRDTDEGLPVALTASGLSEAGGSVLVIEDLSELIAAQRASAWREVARRMAHEIKNPLTPIQLSAERIAKRFVASNGDKELDLVSTSEKVALKANDKASAVIKDGTDTILREVSSLKSMVDEFSRFARLPNAKLEMGDVNEIIRQAVLLYEGRESDVRITSQLADDMPEVLIDEEQLKRVFVNLIDNAIEAFDDDQRDKEISIKSFFDPARDLSVIEIADNGSGIHPSDFRKLFQPYFSTKGRGTGLGLAIVQRIISEHGGKIRAGNNPSSGAKFNIELPNSN